ncbi:TniB family NTP-binding protein, partial [Yinghuangia sp. YIM S10712]|uniref:TniB family NTP-binding protein n=1 Tax=Yinghuangia sp. YIM S10712 TaxID=3436930 RepID=UPI003F5333A8
MAAPTHATREPVPAHGRTTSRPRTPPAAPPEPGDPPRSRDERHAYQSEFVTVRTPAIDTLAPTVRTLMVLGRHQHTTARPALIVTEPAAAGKTTALLHVGRACHLAHAGRSPTPSGQAHAHVPVAYVLVPPGATAKTLAAEFARCLGIPVIGRMTQARITEAVCHTYNRAGVRLVLTDEIHRPGPHTTTGAEAADLLKALTERIAATFVYAGIDVAATALFAGVRGAELAGRASLVECGVFPARLGTREPFKELIAGVEDALDLRAHKPGTLPRLASYLHQHTAGRIGSLTHPVRHAAINTAGGGAEKVRRQGGASLWRLCAAWLCHA